MLVITGSILFGICLLPLGSWAGNKAHIEKRVEDLDNLNKKIISDFSHIPKSGTIEYKASVKEGKDGHRVKIIEKKIEWAPTSKEEFSQEKSTNQTK